MNFEGCKNRAAFMALALITSLICSTSRYATAQADKYHKPKYIFYFIGDGMASPQIHATEAYLAARYVDDTQSSGVKISKLIMSKFPVQGIQMSFANDRFITDSAAAGTALATGKKTNVGVVSMNPEGTSAFYTLAEAAKTQGMKVGIVSSVSIDHATPAVFYAHTPSRNNYEEIDQQLVASRFDYFAGGGFKLDSYSGAEYAGKTNGERYAMLKEKAYEHGFTVTDTRAGFDALTRSTGRTIAINPYLDSSYAIPYALNRLAADGSGEAYEGSITLAEFTQKGIDLMDNSRGFFMMVEGGKIDWAAHANDARAVVEDIIALDNAVGVAVEFAKKHPEETLIVVTGDHECGGMTLGYAGTVYGTYYEKLAGQTIAHDDFAGKILAAYTASHTPPPTDIDQDMWQIIFDNFGLDGNGLTRTPQDDLSEYELDLLEDAFDQAFNGGNSNSDTENNLLYGGYNPLGVTLTHLLNRKSGLSWASYSHTALPVPVLAMGVGAKIFDGYYDNTDVAKKIAKVTGLRLEVPKKLSQKYSLPSWMRRIYAFFLRISS